MPSSRLPRSPRWCTPFPASCCTGSGRMVNTSDAPHEARSIVGDMVRLVREWDAFFEKVGVEPIGEQEITETRFPKPRGRRSVLLPRLTHA